LSFWSSIERRISVTSEKKKEANRRNALKSTGPRTPEGKNAVRLNALSHGLLSQEVLLPGEDAEAFRELGESLRAELQPVGFREYLQVDRIIASVWRLRRVNQVEVGIFARARSEKQERREWRDYAQAELKDVITPPSKQMISEQESEIVTLGEIFVRDAEGANAFSKLSRYGIPIERQLYRALHELERLQRARLGGDVPAPVALDVDVSGTPKATANVFGFVS